MSVRLQRFFRQRVFTYETAMLSTRQIEWNGMENCAGVFVCTYGICCAEEPHKINWWQLQKAKKKKLANRRNTMLFTSALFNKINCNAAIFICMDHDFPLYPSSRCTERIPR